MKQLLILSLSILITLSAVAQQGTLEYKMILSRGQEKGMVSASKMMFSGTKIRVETNMAIAGTTIKQAMLMLPEKPNVITMLDESSKTYREVSTGQKTMDKVTLKVVGKEKIQNFNCTHVIVTTQNRPMDMWTTKDISGYENMLAYWKSSISGGNDQMYTELKKAGAEGFVVKMQIPGSMTMELVKYDAKPVSASVFTIPAGYKKGTSMDPEKMKNMTPAERRKAMEEMMKQYGGKQ
ncbi:DUF4412 domain-containing protein [Runella sp.]|jgi:hypothetical protein|uniref:DUF4412 domain-containing protein n=1 Tax=Runella sp. TaxID=1960881 RepID=UPI0026172BA4|nr:DUF4412 domain-containing protein [Runella sp.]